MLPINIYCIICVFVMVDINICCLTIFAATVPLFSEGNEFVMLLSVIFLCINSLPVGLERFHESCMKPFCVILLTHKQKDVGGNSTSFVKCSKKKYYTVSKKATLM